MKVATIRKGLLLLTASSAFVLGCELIVDFDRSKIPVEATDATPALDAALDVVADQATDSPATDGGKDGDADAPVDASDASDADPDADQ